MPDTVRAVCKLSMFIYKTLLLVTSDFVYPRRICVRAVLARLVHATLRSRKAVLQITSTLIDRMQIFT